MLLKVSSPLDISNLQGACRHRMARQVVWGTKAPVGDVTFVFTNIQVRLCIDLHLLWWEMEASGAGDLVTLLEKKECCHYHLSER